MPLEPQIIRDGKKFVPKANSGFVITAMICAVAWDSGKGPFEVNEPKFQYTDKSENYAGKNQDDYPGVPCPISPANKFTLINYMYIAALPKLAHNGKGYKLKGNHNFIDIETGDELGLEPDDVIHLTRVHK